MLHLKYPSTKIIMPKRKRKTPQTIATFPVDSTTNTGYAIGAIPHFTGTPQMSEPITFVDAGDDGCFNCEPTKIYFE